MRMHHVIVLGSVLSAFAASFARADGFMVPTLVDVGKSGKMVTSPRQEAIIAVADGVVQVVLQTHFRAGPEELAWPVPVPRKPDKVEPLTGDPFPRLDSITAPQFITIYPSRGGGGMGCGCGYNSPSLGLKEGGHSPPVVVESEGTAGIFQYVVLAAERADDLTGWLKTNGYAVPTGADRVLARYVKEGWHWLAMKVRTDLDARLVQAPHPIRYTYHDPAVVYPLEISLLSSEKENEILLYVVAPNRYACGNWANREIDPKEIRVEANSPSGTNYERLIREYTGFKGGHLFVTEFAQPGRIPAADLDSCLSPEILESIMKEVSQWGDRTALPHSSGGPSSRPSPWTAT